jgi:Fe-S-cluster-containing dehydrogenase component
MKRYGMVIRVDRCVGCYNCFLACRDEHAGNERLPIAIAQPAGQKWIDVRAEERGTFPKVRVSHVPVPCLHCTDAPCMLADTGGALYRRADGIVLIDPKKAIGRRDIVGACPYGVVFWNEAENVAQKCTFCAHLLDAGWREPRCVEVCPTQAIVFGDLNDSGSAVARLAAERAIEELDPHCEADPSVRYVGLPKRFIAGEVVLADRPDEPAQGIRVSLHNGDDVLVTVTDNYGDFVFDGLADAADYRLRVAHSGYGPREMAVTIGDCNLGMVALQPAK